MISLLKKIRPSIIERVFPDQAEDNPVCLEESVESRSRSGRQILRKTAPDRAKMKVADTVAAMQKVAVKSS